MRVEAYTDEGKLCSSHCSMLQQSYSIDVK